MTKFLIAAVAALGATLAAKAEPTTYWKVKGAEQRFDAKAVDGKVLSFGYANVINQQDGMTGILLSVYKGGAITRTIVTAKDAPEYFGSTFSKGFHWPSWIPKPKLPDWASDFISIGKDIAKLAQALVSAWEALESIADKWNGLFVTAVHKNVGAEAVGRYSQNVMAVRANLTSSPAEKMATAMKATIGAKPSAVTNALANAVNEMNK